MDARLPHQSRNNRQQLHQKPHQTQRSRFTQRTLYPDPQPKTNHRITPHHQILPLSQIRL